MTDFSHLDAIQQRLSREMARLANAKLPAQVAFCCAQVIGAEKELAAEYRFLGIDPVSLDDALSDEELLAELMA